MEKRACKTGEAFHPGENTRQSYEEYRQPRVLPHIKEEFHYRVENRLLVDKIINPRRDKVIMESLANTACNSSSKKKKRGRNHISLENRRKMVIAGSIRKQLQSPTCPQESQVKQYPNAARPEPKNRQQSQKKECQGNKQERFQLQTQLSKSRWMITDSNCFGESCVGKIVKNTKENSCKISRKVAYHTMEDQKPPSSNFTPTHLKKQILAERKTPTLDQYLNPSPPNLKKLERRACHQHFPNKQNFIQVEDY